MRLNQCSAPRSFVKYALLLNRLPSSGVMSILTLVSVVVTAAALFGWLSVRFMRLPITIVTMLLTVIASLILIPLTGVLPGLNSRAVNFVGQSHQETLTLDGLL